MTESSYYFLNETEKTDWNTLRELILAEGSNGLSSFPIGSGCDYFGTVAPDGFMFADGSAISRTEYSELFSIIGTTYGSGDGSTTFNLPDKRSRVSVAKDNGTFNTLGKTGGEETHVLTTSEIPSHNHREIHYMQGNSVWTGSLDGNNTLVTRYGVYFPDAVSQGSANLGATGYATGKTNNVTSIGGAFTEKTGNDQAHNNLQPYLVCNYIIKVKNSNAYTLFVNALGGSY